MSTFRELLKKGTEKLVKAGVPDAGSDAWMLMKFAFEIEKGYYFLHEDDKIEKEQQERYEKLIAEREKRIPLQQITQTAWFMGYPFYVNENVLTPRFDTEILVEQVGKLLKPGMRILDLCTGSGCILLSLLSEYRELNLEGVGADISAAALDVAKENQKRLKVKASMVESNLFSQVEGEFDLIVSNPPYIATGELQKLMPEVRDHEPQLALDGKEDGLYFYREIIKQASGYLRSGGWLCFEIGYDQGVALEQLMKYAGYKNVKIGKDLAGLDRIAIGQL